MHSESRNLTYYDNVHGEMGFFVAHRGDELGIIMRDINEDSIPNIMYSNHVMQGYDENTNFFYGSLWEDDIWLLNEHAVIQNNFEPPQQEFGLVVNGSELDEYEDNIRSIHLLSTNKKNV